MDGVHIMRTIAIVQARTGSTRFPCKILASLHGKPMLSHVMERAMAIHDVDQVVLAVPASDVRLVQHLWPHVYGGSEHDVLGRYAGAAMEYQADIVLRVTGDCPMLAPDLINDALVWYTDPMIDGRTDQYFPICQPYSATADGWDAELFSCELLNDANREADSIQREHVTTWMRESGVGLAGWTFPRDFTALKCSVDTEADLARVSLIMDHLEDKTDFSHTATWKAWEKAGRP